MQINIKSLIKPALLTAAALLGPLRFKVGGPSLVILMYHRILPKSDPRFLSEEPGMIVTPDNFQRQLQLLKKMFTLIRLEEWISARNDGRPLPKKACAITFDDGWRDNFEYALPILQQERVPATIFAVSDMIGTQRRFWPNRMAALLTNADTQTQGPSFDWLRGLQDIPAKPLDRETISSLIHKCKKLSDTELEHKLDLMEQAQSYSIANAKPDLVDWDQLRTMQNSGLIDIGSHTCTHRRLLETLPEATITHEVIESKKQLEENIGRKVNLFCYPNGDTSKTAQDLVSRNYLAAVTTQHGINNYSSQIHTLSRINIHNDISDTLTKFKARLSGWI